jgi:hypothetical protein
MVVPPTGHFTAYRKLLGDWSEISRDIHSYLAGTDLELSRDYLSKVSSDCSLSGNRVFLNDFAGYRLISVGASHSLRDDAERHRAFEAVDSLAGQVIHAFVVDSRRLVTHAAQLEKPGVIYGYAGWKYDPETKYSGYFLEVRIDGRPRGEKAEFFATCWQESVRRLGLHDQFSVVRDGDSWMLRQNGSLTLKTTVGEPSGRNAEGVAFRGFTDLADVRRRLDRLSDFGPLEEQIFSCTVRGRDYAKVQSELNNVGVGWQAIIVCDLVPENVELIKHGKEPNVSELPGASLSWKSADHQLEASATLAFCRENGQWYADICAFCNSAEAQQELSRVLAAAGYERTI